MHVTDSRFAAELDNLVTLYRGGSRANIAEILALAEAAWSSFDFEESYSPLELAGLGEICRQTAIACVSAAIGDPSVWRSRALALFGRAGCTNGIALLFIPPAMNAIRERNLEEALSHLELMALLVDQSDPLIEGEMVRSAMNENTGIVLMDQEKWDLARSALESVLVIETSRGDVRRMKKAACSLTSIEYYAGDPGKAHVELGRIVDDCRETGGAGDLVEIGTANLQRMADHKSLLLHYQVI